jgi:hypothetical protein
MVLQKSKNWFWPSVVQIYLLSRDIPIGYKHGILFTLIYFLESIYPNGAHTQGSVNFENLYLFIALNIC